MRSIFIFAISLFILAACSAQPVQVTVTREVTVTLPPPTATAIPTPTVSPAYLEFQQYVADNTQDYTVAPEGIYKVNPDGTTTLLPGIGVNADGTISVTVNGEEVTIGLDKVSISDENGVQIEGYEDPDGDGNFSEVIKSQAETWAEANNAGFDKENGVAWDKTTGLVIWAQDAKGEWINYPDGNVPIPPGPGYENEPPLMVPYYHSFNEAMAAVTDELPWGELVHVYRASQAEIKKRVSNIYWRPIISNGTWEMAFHDGDLFLHQTNSLTNKANVFVNEMQLPGGNIRMKLIYESNATGHYFKEILIFGDPLATYTELKRIDNCAWDNRGAENLAELCKSETIQIEAPKK